MGRAVKVIHANIERKNEKIRKLAIFLLENPGLTWDQIALRTGLSRASIGVYIRDSMLLKCIRDTASKDILGMIPLAVKGFRDSLTGKNDKIKYFASKDLLQTEKILGAERVDVTITDNSNRTIEELQEIIKDAQKVPAPTIDAELIT